MFKFFQSVVGTEANVPAAAGVMPRVRLRVELFLSAFTILIAAALSHAFFIPWLGYYWDDWNILWDGVSLPTARMIYEMSWDRPAFAWWHGIVFTFIGDRTLIWHVYLFLLIVGGALLLVWALRGLWPERRFATTAIGLLYAVYPGFLGQPYAHLYHIHFFALTMGILSLGATIRALQTEGRPTYWLYTVVAVISAATYLFIYEIYVSFEVLRLLIMGLLYWRQNSKLNRTFFREIGRSYLPYLAVILVFVFWKVFIFKSVRSQTDPGYIFSLYQQNPLGQLIRIPGELVQEFLEATAFAWFTPAQVRAAQATPTTLLVSVVVGVGAAISVLVYERWSRSPVDNPGEPHKFVTMQWARQMALIGLAATLLALLPAIISNMNLRLLQITDRFSLTAVVPIAMLVTGLIFLCAAPRTRPWVVAGLVGIAVMTHFNNGNYYRNVWKGEMDLWWQMSWRVPALQPGTTLVVSVSPDSFFPVEPQEVWAPAGIIYMPHESDQIRLFGLRLTDEVAHQIMTGDDVLYKVQTSIQFKGYYENALILSMPNQTSCLRIVDGSRPEELPQDPPAILNWVAPRSNINQIVLNAPPPTLPPNIFGAEPPHTWCYYFQKAELARQMGDWETVAALGDEARHKNYSPQDAGEWLPFIQGYASVGRCEDARALSAAVLDVLPYIQADVLPTVCKV